MFLAALPHQHKLAVESEPKKLYGRAFQEDLPSAAAVRIPFVPLLKGQIINPRAHLVRGS